MVREAAVFWLCFIAAAIAFRICVIGTCASAQHRQRRAEVYCYADSSRMVRVLCALCVRRWAAVPEREREPQPGQQELSPHQVWIQVQIQIQVRAAIHRNGAGGYRGQA